MGHFKQHNFTAYTDHNFIGLTASDGLGDANGANEFLFYSGDSTVITQPCDVRMLEMTLGPDDLSSLIDAPFTLIGAQGSPSHAILVHSVYSNYVFVDSAFIQPHALGVYVGDSDDIESTTPIATDPDILTNTQNTFRRWNDAFSGHQITEYNRMYLGVVDAQPPVDGGGYLEMYITYSVVPVEDL